jgi:hypothetical protein
MKLRSKWNRFRAWLLLPIPAVFPMAGAPAFAVLYEALPASSATGKW